MRKRAKIGDVIEIAVPKGFAYAQFIAKTKYSDLIRVLDEIHKQPVTDFEELVEKKEKFLIFFPFTVAVWRGIFPVVSNQKVPSRFDKFPLFRCRGRVQANGKALDWWLWDGEKTWFIDQLKSKQKKLPIRQTVNEKMLIRFINDGWTPEKDDEFFKRQ